MFRLTDNQERRATPSCPSDSREVAFPSMRDGRRAVQRAAKTEAIRILGASYGAGCRVGHLTRPPATPLILILRHPSLSLCFSFLFHLSSLSPFLSYCFHFFHSLLPSFCFAYFRLLFLLIFSVSFCLWFIFFNIYPFYSIQNLL